MKTYTFHVNGMHCKSCTVLIESELGELPEITKAKASLSGQSVEISGDFADKLPEHVAQDLSQVLLPHGYSLGFEKKKHDPRWKQFSVALPIALGFVILFLLLQKLNIVNLVTGSNVGYGTAFLIGIIASLSTCMAVVGGLVLSVSASYAKENDKVRPQIYFHIGRLVSFFVLGGVIGALGSVFQLGINGTFILSIAVALILIILGINLLDVAPWMKKIQPTLPAFIGKKVHTVKKSSHALMPALLGIATFFLPCGFTQSMQIYTLTTGSFSAGALTMFFFALGTLPVLLVLSFTSLAIKKKAASGIFFKTAGLVVIFFGIFNVISSLVLIGIIPPIFNF